MDPVPLAIAFAPLALYLLAVGVLNLRRRPTVFSGAADVAALILGLSGLVAVGPMHLFMPEAAAALFGWKIWVLLLAFYFLCGLLYILLARPRLVVLNITAEQLRPVLELAAVRLDAAAKFAGEAVELPTLNVQFHLDHSPNMRSLSLVATGDKQSHSGWRKLEAELATALRAVETSPNPRGFSFVAFALAMLGWPLVQLVQLPPNVAMQRLLEILRM